MEKKSTHRAVFRVVRCSSSDTIQRAGIYIKEHLVAYTGTEPLRATDGQREFKKSLRKIGQYKVNPQYKKQHLKQQAGFVYEILTVENENIETKRSGRAVRTDDMMRQTAKNGHEFGKVNDQLYDLAREDQHGKYLEGTAVQLKFYGDSGEECARKMLSSKFDKYRDGDVRMEIPSDYYDGARAYLKSEIEAHKIDAEALEKKGKVEAAAKKRAEIRKLQKTKRLLKKGKVTSDEIMFATQHPGLRTAIEIGKTAHKAGIAQAKTGAVMAGSVSLIRNLVACMKEELSPREAAQRVAADTGIGAGVSYATAFAGAVATGVMKKSSSMYVRGLSRTGLVSGVITSTTDVAKTMVRFVRGELTGAQCIEELGEQGFGQLGSAMYSTIALTAVKGSTSIAVKAVAGIVGSTVGYAAAVAVYQELATALKEYELAQEERIRIEAECAEATELLCQYRADMKNQVETYMVDHLDTFSHGFDAMDKAILDQDVNGFLQGNVFIQEKLGHIVQFRTQNEFDALMASDESFQL